MEMVERSFHRHVAVIDRVEVKDPPTKLSSVTIQYLMMKVPMLIG